MKRKHLLMLMLFSFLTPAILFAGNGSKNNETVKTTVRSTVKKKGKFNLITVYQSRRNNHLAQGIDGDFLPIVFIGGMVYHSSAACQQAWLNRSVYPGSFRKNNSYFEAAGTATVNGQTTFLIACP